MYKSMSRRIREQKQARVIEAMGEIFKALRASAKWPAIKQMGKTIVARQRVACCGSCSCAEIHSKADDKGITELWACYTHAQSHGAAVIYFFNMTECEAEEAADLIAWGRHICSIIRACGYKTEWDKEANPMKTIEFTF